MRNTSDLSVRGRITELTEVELHGFLTGRLYIVYSKEDFFVFENKEESFKKYEEENMKRIKELVAKEVEFLKW